MQSASFSEEISNTCVRRVASSSLRKKSGGFTSFIRADFCIAQRRTRSRVPNPPASNWPTSETSSTSTRTRSSCSIRRRKASRAAPRTIRPEQFTTATSCKHSTWYWSSICLFIRSCFGKSSVLPLLLIGRGKGRKVSAGKYRNKLLELGESLGRQDHPWLHHFPIAESQRLPIRNIFTGDKNVHYPNNCRC